MRVIGSGIPSFERNGGRRCTGMFCFRSRYSGWRRPLDGRRNVVIVLGRGLFHRDGSPGSLVPVVLVIVRIRTEDAGCEAALDCQGHILVDGAGVGLFFLNTKLGQQLEDLVGLDLQLPRQLVNSDLQLHR
jgi:hypothetical protein